MFIAGGNFVMGSPKKEAGRETDEKQREVAIKDFYLAKSPVTIVQFEEFINDTGFSTEAGRSDGSYIWTGKKVVKKSNVNWRCDVKGEMQKK